MDESRLGRPGRRAVLAVSAVVALLVVSLAGAPAASAATIDSAGPLERIETTVDLNCAVDYAGDTFGSFFGDTACGTFVAAGGVLYGPASVPAGGSAAPLTPFTPVSQTPVSGDGSATNPFSLTTVVDLGASGLRISQTDTYVVGQESYSTSVTLANTTGAAVDAIIYRAGDCFLADDDRGFGAIDGPAVSCVGEDDRIIQWFPLTAGSSSYEASFSQVWSAIGSQQPFDNTCRCEEFIDNGAGLSWSRSIPAGGSATVAHITTFSPLGFTPLSVAKSTSTPQVEQGATASYTISIPNPNPNDVVIETVVDTLPEGFTYVVGSTSGVTTQDPTVAANVLTWSPGATIAPGGTLELSFSVTVSASPGTYLNVATATAGPVFVVGSGETAAVTVVAPPTPPPTTGPTTPPPSTTPTTTPTTQRPASTTAPAARPVTAQPTFTG